MFSSILSFILSIIIPAPLNAPFRAYAMMRGDRVDKKNGWGSYAEKEEQPKPTEKTVEEETKEVNV